MEYTSCIDDQTTTSDTITSTVASPVTTTTLRVELRLCRAGSGASSVVIDLEGGVEVEAEAPARKLPSSKFKGVVPQPNGRWGAQIYEKHQRVWLGTFNEEDEAAKAYDIAVQRFRGEAAITNFKQVITTLEASFLSRHSKSEIVDMLRKHTYNDELEQSKRTHNVPKPTSRTGSVSPREHMFQKTVTPSDVGKLNRLVIPKQHAEKHFPVQKGSVSKGVLLHFEDNDSKIWRFRYSYWNSSQSYVLTKGWSRFVKEKNLKAGDCVRFMRSTGSDPKQLYIDWESRTGSGIEPAEVVEPVPVQMLRLFGVEIWSVGSCIGKRSSNREVDLIGFENCKKQRVIDVL